MADNATGLNAQYDAGPFPGIVSGTESKFRPPGSQGITAPATAGPVVGTPVVSTPGMSSQPAEGRPTLPVTSGDTSSMSDDLPAHASVLVPGPESDLLSTGAGDGRAGHFTRYPWQQPDGRA